MTTLLFIVFVVLFCKGIKAGISQAKYKPRKDTTQAGNNLQTLYSLQAQRDTIADMLSEIDFKLDMCPGEKTREKLLKDKIRLRGQLATVENKIYKLIN